jgi:hypothetical protein
MMHMGCWDINHDRLQLEVCLLARLAINVLQRSQRSLTFVAGTTFVGCVFYAVLLTGLLQTYALVLDTVGLPCKCLQCVPTS